MLYDFFFLYMSTEAKGCIHEDELGEGTVECTAGGSQDG